MDEGYPCLNLSATTSSLSLTHPVTSDINKSNNIAAMMFNINFDDLILGLVDF